MNCEESSKRKRRWAEGQLMNEEMIENRNSTKSANKLNKREEASGNLISQQERQLEFRIRVSKSRLSK